MGKRLNDTMAVKAMIPYESQSEHYSRTVRKIDNGYVTSHHGHDPNGPDGPTHKEIYTAGHPDGELPADKMDTNSGAMKRAVDFMNKC